MNIFYREHGEGTPVVLIHGFCETSEIWEGFENILSSYGRIISIDLPGFGKSPLPAGPISIDMIAEIVLKWLKDKQIIAPVVIGHSLGGYITLAMAAIDPTYFDKLVLFHSSVYADSDEKKATRDKVIDFVTKNGVDPFIQTFVPTLFYNKSHPAIEKVRHIGVMTRVKTLIEYTKAMRNRPSREEFLRQYIRPTLFIAGVHDEIIPLEISRKMSSIGSKSTFFVLPESGHMGMIESRLIAAEAIGRFLKD